jgi:hypothetical protein
MNNLNKKFYLDDFSRKYPMSSLVLAAILRVGHLGNGDVV